MMRATLYANTFLIGFFYFTSGMLSAHNLEDGSSLITMATDSVLFNAAKVTDSTVSKKKPKESEIKRTSVKKSFRNQRYQTNLRKDVFESARWEKGNSVSTNNFVINDQFEPSTLSNIISLNVYDKALNVHSFSGTQSTMHPLNFTFENTVNTKIELYGFEYRFKRTESKKFGYFTRVRFERDNANNSYYQIGVGGNLKRDKGNNFVGIVHFPVRSGPGHMLKLYRTQLSNYNEFQVTDKLKHIALLEGNYYSDQNGNFIVSSRTEYVVVETSMFSIAPLVEGAYGLGTIDRRDAYPYWMADKRIYGGGGLALGIGSASSNFQMIADASIFGEVDQASFERYTVNLSYRIKDFTTINAGFEVYTIENFYSNVFQLGMVYNFK